MPQVHIDQTKDSSIARVHRHLPAEDVPALLAKRFQIVNLWRPIHHVALDFPLALCDYRTVDRANDLVATTLRYPDRDGETFSVKYNPANRWKYVRGMEPDEFVLIKWCVSPRTWRGTTVGLMVTIDVSFGTVSTRRTTARPLSSRPTPLSRTRLPRRTRHCGSPSSSVCSCSTISRS